MKKIVWLAIAVSLTFLSCDVIFDYQWKIDGQLTHDWVLSEQTYNNVTHPNFGTILSIEKGGRFSIKRTFPQNDTGFISMFPNELELNGAWVVRNKTILSLTVLDSGKGKILNPTRKVDFIVEYLNFEKKDRWNVGVLYLTQKESNEDFKYFLYTGR